MRLRRVSLALATVSLLGLAGCVGSAWNKSLQADSAAAYHEFLQSYPNSPYVDEAKERIAFHTVMRRPSLAGYEGFRARYPESSLLQKIRPAIEDLALGSARRAGTEEAYAAFEAQFPAGPHARRVRGNVAYLKEIGPASVGNPAALQTFAKKHPESDFADEARRSVEALSVRTRTHFRRVRLEIDIAEGTPDQSRIVKAFRERAVQIYKDAGIELVLAPKTRQAEAPTATLRITHREETGNVSVLGNDVSSGGLAAHTVVTLQRDAKSAPAWRQEFVVRVPSQQVIAGASALFASKQARLYWDEFFVPVATWHSNTAVRSPLDTARPLASVDAADGRAIALFEDGTFDLFDLADPEHPLLVARHTRPSSLEHYQGVRIRGDRVMLHGEDGLEIVALGAGGPHVIVSRSRSEVGSINAVHPVADGLLLASSRGLVLTDAMGKKPKVLMRRALRGLDGNGRMLVFTDGETVYATTLELLRSGRVLEQFRLGRDFAPGRVRVHGGIAVVMGEGGTVLIGVRGDKKPRIVSRFERARVGEVRDALEVDGRIHLLGSRGLLLLDRNVQQVVESVDVSPRHRAALTGRHLVVVGGSQLQVVDMLPFTSKAAALASPGSAPR